MIRNTDIQRFDVDVNDIAWIKKDTKTVSSNKDS